MPADEIRWTRWPSQAMEELLRRYKSAQVILEYGSGHSTALACELHKTVFSVESDKEWANAMRRYLKGRAKVTGADVTVHYVNIGETGKWGHPVSDAGWRKYPEYAFSVWDLPTFSQWSNPDVVLIDGRFRAGCFFACAALIEQPTVVLFDDYRDRPQYHAVEDVCKPTRFADRLAVFHLEPGMLAPQHLRQAARALYRPA